MIKIFRIMLGLISISCMIAMAGCTKDDPENPEESDNGFTKEGIYLGVVGFNDQLHIKDIGLLNSSTVDNYTSFINNLSKGNGTGLYYADYTALKMMRECTAPPKLKNVVLVTFTDGLDNISLANDSYNPGNYGSQSDYRNALHNMIVNDKIHGCEVSAYTIGLKGNDVTDNALFMETLKKLASSDNNVYQVSNMNEAIQRFEQIASSLNSISTSFSLGVDVPGGYDDGQLLRFTFDNANAAASSSCYIEATYRRTNGGRTLADITYHGLAQGPASISSTSSHGAYHHFQFENLKYSNGNPLTQTDMNKIMLWKKTSSGGWDRESEFDPASSSTVTEDKNSALIMLVLDCTTSLGNDFSKMQQAGKSFVKTLSNAGGNSSGDDGDDGDDDINPHNYPTTFNETFDGNEVSMTIIDADEDGYCWSIMEDYGVNGSNCAVSFSYNTETENGIDCDNYLFTPTLYIPQEGRTLTYSVSNATSDYPDRYSIIVFETDDGTFNLSNGKVIQATTSVSVEIPNFLTKSISLSQFKGKSIVIGFRHKDYDKYALLLDNVIVR